MVGQHGLPFPVLTDPGCALAEQFGLAYTIPDYHRDYYRSILVNIPFVNGDQTWRLILPATYVLARDRRVLYAQAHADFRVRPEPEEVLAAAPWPPSSKRGLETRTTADLHPTDEDLSVRTLARSRRYIRLPSRKCISTDENRIK